MNQNDPIIERIQGLENKVDSLLSLNQQLIDALMDQDELLTAQQAATLLDVNVQTIRRRISSGEYKNYAPARKPFRVKKSDIMRGRSSRVSAITLL